VLAVRYGFLGTAPSQADAAVPAKLETQAMAASSAADIAAGRKIFNTTCAHCHGPDAIQGEQRRNLRLLRQRYGDKMDETFLDTVTHGRIRKGMPNWSGVLTDEEFHRILAFLTSVQAPVPPTSTAESGQ
jgi:polar amino acid transport system substrate-binding protein